MLFISPHKEALLILKTYRFLPWHFDHVEKQFDEKDKINFKIYDVTTWETNNCNAHVDHYLKNVRQSGSEVWSVNRI